MDRLILFLIDKLPLLLELFAKRYCITLRPVLIEKINDEDAWWDEAVIELLDVLFGCEPE